MTQELLDRPNIIAVLDQVRGERVPERMAARPPGDADVQNCLPHCTLDHAFMHVMTPLAAASRVSTSMLGGKEPLPTPVFRRPGKLEAEGVGQEDLSDSGSEVLVVDSLDAGKPRRKRGFDHERQRSDAVSLPFRVAD
jgi:hypothetical protein